jgi:hypothetical protein
MAVHDKAHSHITCQLITTTTTTIDIATTTTSSPHHHSHAHTHLPTPARPLKWLQTVMILNPETQTKGLKWLCSV